MRRGIPYVPPPGLRAHSIVVDGEQLVIFSYPADDMIGASPGGAKLTPAEVAVARLLLAGHSNAQIACLRGVTASTVAKQIEKVFRHHGVHSRAELAALLSSAADGPQD
jgi:DNA-binding NarL/FixJ family response regulator